MSIKIKIDNRKENTVNELKVKELLQSGKRLYSVVINYESSPILTIMDDLDQINAIIKRAVKKYKYLAKKYDGVQPLDYISVDEIGWFDNFGIDAKDYLLYIDGAKISTTNFEIIIEKSNLKLV